MPSADLATAGATAASPAHVDAEDHPGFRLNEVYLNVEDSLGWNAVESLPSSLSALK